MKLHQDDVLVPSHKHVMTSVRTREGRSCIEFYFDFILYLNFGVLQAQKINPHCM